VPQENVEIVRRGFEAWNAGDVAGLRALHHPDVIVYAPADWPEPGPIVGGDAAMKQWERMREAWDTDSAIVAGDLIGVGDRVVGRFAWRVGGHGPDLGIKISAVWTVRDGKIVHMEFYLDHIEALKVPGLEE
jgi:ketosteroid isomerase-like protein